MNVLVVTLAAVAIACCGLIFTGLALLIEVRRTQRLMRKTQEEAMAALRNDGFYDDKHWEQLIETIVERIGVERFLDTSAYVLARRSDTDSIAEAVERLAMAAKAVGCVRKDR